MGDPTAFVYVTPSEYITRMEKQGVTNYPSLEELRTRANAPDRMCEVCGALPAWKYMGLGMCFPCTTGETDASSDIELVADRIPDEFATVPARAKIICPDCNHRVRACGYWQHRRDKHGDFV